ncbi:phosphate ABC transporter permease PstA [Methanobrevibacter boviskoreani]|uniref:phosphate ABC transporter permease PstA n=1 Tax=Methanobrevibacter boviskoreani TaxID=1348249 RepID=UPI0023F32CAF|nr:phosphate ABC transporter permease PstA [Methanobrevibacter boviskoreani]MDD6256106.1 phosphate ABC transporter permease PstA [Methanobrevibacter boviskoreani]
MNSVQEEIDKSSHKMSSLTTQKIMNGIFLLSGLITILILVVIIGYILIEGLPAVNWTFLTSDPIDSGRSGGIFPIIISSLYVTAIALIIASPLAVGAAIYISEYAKNEKIKKVIRFGAQTLASIPSIIFGLFGLQLLVITLNLGYSVLCGGIILAFMALPTIFQVAEVTVSSVPSLYKEGSLGLGATKWQTITGVVLPAALPGIITGIILGLTRAISEAAAVMFCVGSAVTTPISIMDPGRPLPLHLYVLATEGVSLQNAYGTAAVLVFIILIITLLTNYLVNRYQAKMRGER